MSMKHQNRFVWWYEGKKANVVAGRLMEIDLFPRLFLYAAQFGVWQNFSIE